MGTPEPTGRFSQRAGAYGRHRPGYPEAVFDFLLAGLGAPLELVVADVGAGTGLATRRLAACVARVFAIEPNAAMRAQAEPSRNVAWLDGTAERTGLPDRAVDVAAAFQAFHWFEADRAFPEFLRIARRRIALVQYERDETQRFARAYGDLIRPYRLDGTEARRLRALEAFATHAGGGLRRAVLPFGQALTLQDLLGLLESSSYLPHEGEPARRLRQEAALLFEAFAQDGQVEMARSAFVLVKDLD